MAYRLTGTKIEGKSRGEVVVKASAAAAGKGWGLFMRLGKAMDSNLKAQQAAKKKPHNPNDIFEGIQW